MGPVTDAEFIAAADGDLRPLSPAPTASPVWLQFPWDSGKVSGNLRRPRRYRCGLQLALYLSAQANVFFCPVSKAYRDRKRRKARDTSKPSSPSSGAASMSSGS